MSNKKDIYKTNFARIISISAFPLITGFLFILIFFYQKSNSNFDLVDSIITFALFKFTTGIYIVLFLNHLPLAKHTILKILNKRIFIKQYDTLSEIDFDEIDEIIEYSTSKLPWSKILLWEIRTYNKNYFVSSLTISRSIFHRFFWDKIEDKSKVFPTI